MLPYTISKIKWCHFLEMELLLLLVNYILEMLSFVCELLLQQIGYVQLP